MTKTFHLGKDDVLHKTSGGQLVEGLAETKQFTTLADFAGALAKLSPACAMIYGHCGYDQARVVTQAQLATSKEGRLPVIARTREFFQYPAGPAILMIDHDVPKEAEVLPDGELLSRLYRVCPALEYAPHVIAQSASSFIYDGDHELIGQRGRRIYVLIADGRDIPRAGNVLFKRLQLAGFGHVEIGKAGQFLERSPIDAAVYQPERLDFCGGAFCQAPLEQHRPLPVVYNSGACPLNTREALPDLTSTEESKRREIVAALKESLMSQAVEIRKMWTEERVAQALGKEGKTAISHPLDAAKLREVYHGAVEHHDLYGAFELAMADGTTVTVAHVLANTDRYHGQRLADPLEPDYGNDPRIAMLNLRTAGSPYAYSHAHGGIRYNLRRERQTHVVRAGERIHTVEAALSAMRVDGTFFERNGEIVRVTDEGVIVPLNCAGLLLELDRLVRWKKPRPNEDVPCDCPRHVAEGVMTLRGQWRLPRLNAVATVPLYHPKSGRIIERDGYDAETGILVVCPDFERLANVPANPTKAQVEEALAILMEPFREFPFLSPQDRGAFVAALLTAMGRPAFATAPGILITASTAGSGKSLLAKCLSLIAGCEIPVVMAGTEDDTEMRKRLIAVGRRGAPATILDNLTGSLESDALCAWLTSEFLADRILGQSEEVMVRTGGLMVATGNNVSLKGDLCRRILTCRIEPNMETPWKRAFDLDPAQYCRENRLAMVFAGLTVVRYYMNQPNPLQDRTASFEDWSDTVRRVVVGIANDGLLDVVDPVVTIDAAYAEDPETSQLRALLASCHARFGKSGVTVSQMIEARGSDETLNTVLEEIAGDGFSINPRRLGRWLDRNAGRVIDGLRFEKDGKLHGSTRWVVRGDLGGFGGAVCLGQDEEDVDSYRPKQSPQSTLAASC